MCIFYKNYINANNIYMDIFLFIVVGFLNGLFSTGAGQLLIFYLVYIQKQDTKKSREFSLSIMPLISIPTFIYYMLKIQINFLQCIVFVIISLICGYLGNKTMKKMNGNILNLISGFFLVVLTCYSLWRLK